MIQRDNVGIIMAISMGWKSDQCTKMDAHSGGRDPPSPPRIFNGGGDAHRVKRDAHPRLPYEHPSPPYVPVTPYEQLKFLVGYCAEPVSPTGTNIRQTNHRAAAYI